mgnify:CR=1 FL=1
MTLGVSIRHNVTAKWTNTVDLGESRAGRLLDIALTLTDGVDAGEVDRAFIDTRTIAASGTDDLDLAGTTLVDAFGVAQAFARVKGLWVRAAAANTNLVVVGGDASGAWASWVDAAGNTVRLGPGSWMSVGGGARGVGRLAKWGGRHRQHGPPAPGLVDVAGRRRRGRDRLRGDRDDRGHPADRQQRVGHVGHLRHRDRRLLQLMFTYKLKPTPIDEGGPGGKQFEVTADSRDVLAWEKGGQGRSLSRLLVEPNVKDTYVLAWLACKRTGKVDCPLAEFEAKYLIVFGALQQLAGAAPDPTRPAR